MEMVEHMMGRGSATPSPQYLGVTPDSPRDVPPFPRAFHGASGLPAMPNLAPPLLPRQRPAYCGKPPEGLLEVPAERVKPGMESTAQVPCTLSLPGTPPTALVKRMNFAQALDHVPAAEAQLVGSTDKQHVLNNWRPALPPFPRGIPYMCICVL
ncbi:hypothetical protein M431DRAFT_436629 [Trichoderma harzianum CBS 226.95]|uniref:Uncharacterized protein n=1 Tax=Trichoderma harzianum CBS 226.95 TaxID=983964 RepID=A0A2T4AD94_TRIHA|nr:hypothetical protein M431DRAFT_436629 [Trichoderma harzianum CBS 226.95]PTB55049.1 hypothetical protein M431DRAFT_436629 [Trichoderma harzianum CBS 226.95]